MDPAEFDDLVADLRGAQIPRVWSLLVTVFGDLVQDGSAMSSGVLGHVMAQIGIRPEAMRVALHRLRKDGWIESERRGRSSIYKLSARGRHESAAASPRIYGAPPPSAEVWLVLPDPSGPMDLPAGAGIWVAPNVLLTQRVPGGADAYVSRVAPGTLPDWMRNRICDPETMRLSQDLSARLRRLDGALAGEGALDAMQDVVLRVLIVHEWRRLVLKTPILPDAVFPQGWAGAACRLSVAALLDRLQRQTPDALEQALD